VALVATGPSSLQPDVRSYLTASRKRTVAGYLLATCGTLALIACLLPFRDDITALSEGFLFLFLVVATVVVGGLGPGLAASIAAFLGFNFFFIPPYGTFRIGKAEDVVMLFVFLILAVLIAVLIAQARARADAAEARESELQTQQELSRLLVEPQPGGEGYDMILRAVVGRFGYSDGALFVQPYGDLTGLEEAATVDAQPGSIPMSGEGEGIERLSLSVGRRNLGLIVLRGTRPPLEPAERRILASFTNQLALLLERDRVIRAAVEAQRTSSRPATVPPRPSEVGP
jgi:two-component system sensor histidine kinase KdpD